MRSNEKKKERKKVGLGWGHCFLHIQNTNRFL